MQTRWKKSLFRVSLYRHTHRHLTAASRQEDRTVNKSGIGQNIPEIHPDITGIPEIENIPDRDRIPDIEDIPDEELIPDIEIISEIRGFARDPSDTGTIEPADDIINIGREIDDAAERATAWTRGMGDYTAYWVQRLLWDRCPAEHIDDVVHDIAHSFIMAEQKYPIYKPYRWIKTAMKRAVINHMRSPDHRLVVPISITIARTTSAPGLSPEELAIRHEQIERAWEVLRVLAQLEPQHAQAFIADVIEQIPRKDIAKRLGIAQSTLSRWIESIRQDIKRACE
jgi:RNA polymerase sigma factor (sigma-70 family)